MIKRLFGPNECVTFPKSKQMFLNEPFADPLILAQSFNTVVSAGNSRIELNSVISAQWRGQLNNIGGWS